MGGTLKTNKNCVRCGCLMRGVGWNRRYCPDCKAVVNRERKRKARQERPPQKTPPRRKTLVECSIEAANLGISYGEYVQRGLDRQ